MIKVLCDGCEKEIDIDNESFSQWDGYQMCDDCHYNKNTDLKKIFTKKKLKPKSDWKIDIRDEVKEELNQEEEDESTSIFEDIRNALQGKSLH